MKQNGRNWCRWRIVSLVVGWCVFLALAAVMGLKRLTQRKPISLPVVKAPQRPASSVPTAVTPQHKPGRPFAPPLSDKIRRESGEVNARYVFFVVFGWFIFVFVGLAFLMHTYVSEPPYPKPPLDSSYPVPRLITHPFALQPPYLAAQQQALEKVSIPITRAMAEIAARPDPYAPLSAGEAHGQ